MTTERFYADISLEEEARIPLPPNWIRAMKLSAGSSTSTKIYRSMINSQETYDHPVMTQALTMVKNRPLPFGWSEQVHQLPNGETEKFFYNADLDLSMWDHPLLRECVTEYLLQMGLDLDYISSILQFSAQRQANRIENEPSVEVKEEATTPPSERRQTPNKEDIANYFSDSSTINTSVDSKLRMKDMYADSDSDGDAQSRSKSYPLPDSPPPPEDDSQTYQSSVDIPSPIVVSSASKWENTLVNIIASKEAQVSPHKIEEMVQLPISIASLKILKYDIFTSVQKVHDLIQNLRSLLASMSNYQCSFIQLLDNQTPPQYEESEDINRMMITLASDIVTELKQQPQYIIAAMASNSNVDPIAMQQTALISLHRLLHPFSTDNSLTTALLLEGINHQLAELQNIEQLLENAEDSKRVLAKAIFIADPDQALAWDPVQSPLPTFPNASSETVLSCLVRTYAIRRDVTCYFRAIWIPVLPAVSQLLQNNFDNQDPLVLCNLFTVANRLLECTFSEKAMTVFPPIATAILRAVHETGGQEAMLSLLFDLIILPNMVKIVGGDHDSLENENVYNMESVRKLVNKYYDYNLWLHAPNTDGLDDGAAKSLDILTGLIWMVWRLFSLAVYLNDVQIQVLSAQTFLSDRMVKFNSTGLKDRRLQQFSQRMKSKILNCCKWVICMPLDMQGSQYLGLNEEENLAQLPTTAETQELMGRRISSLAFKPAEMLNLTLVSKQELLCIFTDVGVAMDEREVSMDIPIYEAVRTFLSLFSQEGEEEQMKEEFLLLVFLYQEEEFHIENLQDDDESVDKESIARRYWQLIRGMKLCLRYEDTLVNLIRKIEEQITSNVHELVTDHLWYSEPEFDLEFKADHVDIAQKHTTVSRSKIQNPKYGLQKDQHVKIFPIFSQHNAVDHHPNHKSLKALQADIIASYRFGSAQKGVDAGTSMGRQKLLKPKVGPKDVKVSTMKDSRSEASSRSTRSAYTTSQVNPSSSFLSPTESFRNQKFPSRISNKDYDESFMRSMRGHDIIPTDEFQMRYTRRKRGWYFHGQDQLHLSSSHSTAPGHRESQPQNDGDRVESKGHKDRVSKVTVVGSSCRTVTSPSIPLPFPEHLRSRIRKDPGDEIPYPQDPSEQSVHIEKNMHDPAHIKKLIAEHHAQVLNITPPPMDDTKSIASKRSHHSRRDRSRSRSPSMPRPFESTNNLLSPTKSVASKLSVDFKSEHNRERAFELRQYEPNEYAADHSEPFLLTKTKFYPPSGPRVPRVPQHLAPPEGPFASDQPQIIVKSDKDRNAEGEGRRGRSRSRSPSPTTPIRRRSTYLSPTSASMHSIWPGLQPLESQPASVEKEPASPEPTVGSRRQSYPSPMSAFKSRALSPTPDSPLGKSEAFAKAVAMTSKELQEKSNATSYSIVFDSNQEHISKLKLTADDERAESREDFVLEEDGDEVLKAIKYDANGGMNSPQLVEKDEKSVRPIPLVKRQSVVADAQDMRTALKIGLVAIKFGRSGPPKKKLIRYNAAEATIEWSSASASERRGSLIDFFSRPKNKPPSSIEVSSICEVCKGIQTEVLHKAGLIDPNCCLSMVTSDRSLDLCFSNAVDRDNVLRGLKVILEGMEHVKFV